MCYSNYWAVHKFTQMLVLLSANPLREVPVVPSCTATRREYFSLHRTCRKDQYSTPTSTPARGSYCCAQFTADDEWYRAKVLDIGRPTPHSKSYLEVSLLF